MRIISGKYKGRILDGFNLNGTRPTMDRVKESIFAMIQTKLKNSVCLDLFAGSGALGLEALSNGASKCYFVDYNSQAINTISKNCAKLDVQAEKVILHQHFEQALDSFRQQNITFDLIFLDPPYQAHLIQSCLEKIQKNQLLKENGLIICEYETEIFDCAYTCIKEKKYGSKNIRIYQFDKS